MNTQHESKWRWSTTALHNPSRIILIEGHHTIAFVELFGDEADADARLIASAPTLLSERNALANEVDELREVLIKVTACVAHAKDRTPGMHYTYAEAEQLARAVLDKHIIAQLDKPSREAILKAGEEAGL